MDSAPIPSNNEADTSSYPPPYSNPAYPAAPQHEFVPQQPGYPPLQAVQQGYTDPVHHQQGYSMAPVPHGGYPAPQQGIAGTAAPQAPYTAGQQPVHHTTLQQQTSTNVVVVTQQPASNQKVVTTVSVGDNYLTLSVILALVCCCCCGMTGLLCTIPAIVAASSARDAERRGDSVAQQRNRRLAIGLNIGACLWAVVCVIISVSVGFSYRPQ